jgi:speckle-type POZ protein
MCEDAGDLKLDKLLQSGKFSDLTLRCDGHEFKVHKGILASKSPVFDAELSGPFKVCNLALLFNEADHAQEASEGIIEIKEFRPETVRQMVQFLYTGDYACDIKSKRHNDVDIDW